MVKLIIFAVISGILVAYSWTSLHDRRAHGFYRFFAFESLLVLLLSNVDHWFTDPLALNQLLSWFFLTCSLFLALFGFVLLRIVGKPRGDFENTTRLVTIGAYRYIRHPLYSSLLFLAWGIFLKDLTLPGTLLIAVTSVFLNATALAEESENVAKFGNDYERYMESTRKFIPFVY